jgi:8-oxo-dGTP pyrophosphatase MutT (NUDIX family)
MDARARRRDEMDCDCGPEGHTIQYAALPYRGDEDVQVLLLTSRDTGRWVLPKGWPMRGRKPHAAARREALEEAGVEGRVGKHPIGSFHYQKHLAGGASETCKVVVYPLAVERQRRRWPEQDQRTVGWFTPQEAAMVVQEPELAALLASFVPSGRDQEI